MAKGQKCKGKINDYELVHKLGEGGNGEVWLAAGPHGDVALKLLKRRRQLDTVPRFYRELEALDRLANVKEVLPLVDRSVQSGANGQLWFAMPVAIPLRKKLQNADVAEISAAFSQLAAGLAKVHGLGVVHRDIKPDNLYWYDGRWVLGDFGLSDFDDAEPLTQSDRKLGPAFYIAPEMLNDAKNSEGHPADVYSLGKTIWVCATGQNYPLPGVHEPAFLPSAIASFNSDPRAASLDELLRRMTQLDPQRRPSAEFISEELALLTTTHSMTTPPDPASALWRLKNAVAPHLTEEQERSHRERIGRQIAEQLREAIGSIALTIRDQTGLESIRWYRVPASWGHTEFMGSPSIEWSHQGGFVFAAGPPTNRWHFAIGFRCQLLSNGNMVQSTGYHLDHTYNDHSVTTMDDPELWRDGGESPNGTPSAIALLNRLITGLHDNLSSAVEEFCRCLERR